MHIMPSFLLFQSLLHLGCLKCQKKRWSAYLATSSASELVSRCCNPLEGADINIAYNGFEPNILVNFNNVSNPGGSEIDLTDILAKKLGFSVHYNFTQFGYFDRKSKEWKGKTRAVSETFLSLPL